MTIIKYMDKGQRITIWIMCAVSLILSVTAVCMAYYHTPDLGFDYQGVIVGVLSLLVTVLIGWNIYNLIDLNNTRKTVSSLLSETTSSLNKNMAITDHSFWMVYHYLLLNKDPMGLDYQFLYHGMSCLFHTSMFGDIKTCNVIVKAMLECVTKPQNITITRQGKMEILKLVSMTKNPDLIQGFVELTGRISLINVKD